MRVAEVATPVLRAASSVNGLNEEPAGCAARTALLKRAEALGVGSRLPASVVPSVIAFGLKSGADASAQTSPLRGSTTAVAALLYGRSDASAVACRSFRMVIV